MDKNKLILPLSIVLGSIIIGGSFYATQVKKQDSIERQQIRDIEQKNIQAERELNQMKEIEKMKIDEEQKKAEQDDYKYFLKEAELDQCIKSADDKYWKYMELNGEKNDDGTISAKNSTWDSGNKLKQEEIQNCHKRYPID